MHRPVPHLTLPHAWSAVQRTSQALPPEHVIAPHAPLVVQLIAQFQRLGQVIAPPPSPSIVQVAVAVLHEVQIDGHVNASACLASGVPTMQ